METTQGGGVSLSPARSERGGTVTITPEPEAGYAVDEITVTGPGSRPVEVTGNGDGSDTLDPGGTATRAQAAAMLMRFCRQYIDP